jgi:hypothetical protein
MELEYTDACLIAQPILSRQALDVSKLFGPSVPDISRAERGARLRDLRAAVLSVHRDRTDLIDALVLAEDGDAEWLARARAEFERLPSLQRRQVHRLYLRSSGAE